MTALANASVEVQYDVSLSPGIGGIDGAFGPGTYNAITAYARDEGVSLSTTAKAYGAYDGLLY